MKEETQSALNALNGAFYEARGADFDATRDHPWPGWSRALDALAREAPARAPDAAPRRVLDVGCGNGRFGVWLARRDPTPTRYLGVDASDALLARARRAFHGSPPAFSVELRALDFLQGEGPEGLPPGPFDLVVLFGVLHHVPGEALRRRLLVALAGRVAPAGGLVLTAWQFAHRARFARSLLSDDVVRERAPAWGFDASDLEPGDHLLGFGGSASVPRYCHHVDAAELARLTRDLGLTEIDAFDADGKSDDLNAYRVLVRPAT
jgi:SAM-dependent methyltransferase